MKTINYLLGYKDLRIIQDPEMFNFSLDSVLLPNFITINENTKKILDIGTGNGPIPLILSTKTKAKITGIEIQKEVSNMATDSVKLNKLEKQQIYPKTEEYDLGEQLCECLLQFENVWEENDIEIETEIADDVKVNTDQELLSLVWNNLFSNAFKFTPKGGKVTLILEATEDHAIVKVKDTGCGMSPEVGAHIFEKFYQGDTSHATQGNGLGLALVKRVVDILHGEISVESTLGKGSTLIVKFRKI